MSGTELFTANRASTTVSSGGTSAPASGTTETWTVASSAMFGAAATGISQFHVADQAAPTEIIAVTNVSGTTWTVTRGAEGTTPVAHSAGFTIYQVITEGFLGSVVQSTGTPVQGEVPVAAGGTTAQASWNGIFGTRPEWFGSISGTSGDEVAINAAISAVAAGAAGCPGPVVITQPCAISNTITAQTGVNLAATGQGNRQVFPDTFTGGYIFPASTFSTAGVPLITVGTASAPTTNPCGMRLDGICLSGYTGSSNIANCIGIQITDTADVHLIGCFFANFDRGGATGTAVNVSSSSAGNGVGLNVQNCVISSSWRGVYASGAGVTDMRFASNLWHSNTEQITIGASNLGGGGCQIVNDHFTYTGMPTAGWHLQMGSQAGDFMITNCYFDQGGSAVVVQLATAKGVFCGNHFLATATSSAAQLVKLSTSAAQEITFCNNDCNANGSSITALFATTAHSGAPTGGVYVGNAVYGTAASLIAVLIDSGSSAIAAANTSSLYVQGNVSFA